MSSPTEQTEEVRIVREIAVPAERVYDAFVDPEQLARWIGPLGPAGNRVELDSRVGGKADIYMDRGEGRSGSFHWQFVEMDRPRRLVLDFTFGPDEGPVGLRSKLTLGFREKEPGVTELTLVHDRLGGVAPEMRASINTGWTTITGRLAAMLETGDRGGAA